jgi:hypothetical protein
VVIEDVDARRRAITSRQDLELIAGWIGDRKASLTDTVWPLVNPSMVRRAPAFPPVRLVMVPSLKGPVEVGAP